jgi:hypothetical protein
MANLLLFNMRVSYLLPLGNRTMVESRLHNSSAGDRVPAFGAEFSGRHSLLFGRACAVGSTRGACLTCTLSCFISGALCSGNSQSPPVRGPARSKELSGLSILADPGCMTPQTRRRSRPRSLITGRRMAQWGQTMRGPKAGTEIASPNPSTFIRAAW